MFDDRHHEHDNEQLREIREAVTALTRVVQNSATETVQIITEAFTTIHNQLGEIMSDQSHLDADVAALGGVLSDIEAEVAALKAANPAVDFTALDALVASAQANDPGAPAAPPATPPADTPPATPPAA